ncbi:hypothetical protein [Enterococcus sp. AZ196]|uniref:hypothetical protein n=1 Tax=Enterococcus sp. AZ196 TaxID=2774659 RepID=UPI003D273FB0
MSERIKVINYLESLFRQAIPESYYMKNRKKKVVYPYMTFTLSGEPIRFTGQGFYIDMDVFDDKKNSDVDLLKAVSAILEKFPDHEPFNQLTDDFLVQINYQNDSGIPTGSDTLQRHTLQLYAKIDWRK